MTVKEAIDKFLITIKSEGVKPTTIKWYQVRFIRFIKRFGECSLDDLDIDLVRSYIADLRDEELSPHYFYAHARVTRRLFKWLFEERRIEDPFYRRIKLPKIPRQLPKAIEHENVIALLRSCDNSIAGLRDKAIMFLLIDTGCRVGGLCKIKMSNLDLENRKALTIEKGDNPRTILFVDRTAEAIGDWIEVRPFPENEFVFTSLARDVPTNPNSINQMLRRRKKRTGIQGRVNPHSFRHAFGRDFVLHSGDLASTSELMGHSQIHVTKMYYAVFLTEELRPKHSQYSPMNWIPELDEEESNIEPNKDNQSLFAKQERGSN